MQAMRCMVKTFRRPPAGRIRDRNGGLPRLSDGVAHASRCPASPRRALLAENLGKPSRWVIISVPWYQARRIFPWDRGRLAQLVERHVYTVDVGGSIPSPPTTTIRDFRGGDFRDCDFWGFAAEIDPAMRAGRRRSAGRHERS